MIGVIKKRIEIIELLQVFLSVLERELEEVSHNPDQLDAAYFDGLFSHWFGEYLNDCQEYTWLENRMVNYSRFLHEWYFYQKGIPTGQTVYAPRGYLMETLRKYMDYPVQVSDHPVPTVGELIGLNMYRR